MKTLKEMIEDEAINASNLLEMEYLSNNDHIGTGSLAKYENGFEAGALWMARVLLEKWDDYSYGETEGREVKTVNAIITQLDAWAKEVEE